MGKEVGMYSSSCISEKGEDVELKESSGPRSDKRGSRGRSSDRVRSLRSLGEEGGSTSITATASINVTDQVSSRRLVFLGIYDVPEFRAATAPLMLCPSWGAAVVPLGNSSSERRPMGGERRRVSGF